MFENDWRGYIDVTGVPIERLVVEAYSLSVPVGRGYEADFIKSLSEEEARQAIRQHKNLVMVDYVHGRAVKLAVKFDPGTGRAYLPLDWPLHSQEQLHQLLERVGLPRARIAVLDVWRDARDREDDQYYQARRREILVLLTLAESIGRSRVDRIKVDPTSAWGIVAMPHLLAAVRKGWVDTTDYEEFGLTAKGRKICADELQESRKMGISSSPDGGIEGN